MSQAGILSVQSSDPSVPTSFTADDSTTAIPTSNNLNVRAQDTTDDNANGIQTTADPDNGDILYVELTNRVYGTGTVVGATTEDIITFALGGSAAVYRFHIEVVTRETTTGDGSGYTMFGTVKTDGAAATDIETAYQDIDQDTSLADSALIFTASGNNIIIQLTGVAGLTQSVKACGYYIKV